MWMYIYVLTYILKDLKIAVSFQLFIFETKSDIRLIFYLLIDSPSLELGKKCITKV